jgi:uncharacterized protein (TIGR03086 family)
MNAELLARAADRTTAVVRAVAPGRLHDPTPCRDFDVRALLSHLMWVVDLAVPAARKEAADGSVSADRDYVQGDWRASWAAQVAAMTAAWAEPDAWTGTTTFAGGEISATFAGELVLVDLVVHGWDLARATGQPYGCDGDAAEAVYRVVAEVGEMGRSMGLFGEAVAVPDDADPLDRALALSGRDPGWTPPTGSDGLRNAEAASPR